MKVKNKLTEFLRQLPRKVTICVDGKIFKSEIFKRNIF